MKKTGTILDKIISNKQIELDELKKSHSLESLKKNLHLRKTKIRNFKHALGKPGRLNIMAEIKKASPSEGLIRPDFNHIKIAKEYERSGMVDAISVLTESKFFQGSLGFIEDIKAVTSIPIFRKDFIFDEYQVYEAFLAEADALLLIVAALEKQQLKSLLSVAHALNLECLVETHSDEEIKIALDAGANIIGINARNLKTFVLDKTLFKKYAHLIPSGRVKVAESGLENSNDLKEVYSKGANAALIGTSIMSSNNIQQKLKDLTNF